MSVARITEISATSPESFEAAIREGIRRATQTLRNVRGAWIKEQEVRIEGDRLAEFKVNLLITFILEGPDEGEGGGGGGGGRGGRGGRG